MSDPIISIIRKAVEPVVERAVEAAFDRKLKSHKVKCSEGVQQEHGQPKEVLSNNEAQRFLDASKSTLQRWRNQEILPYSKINGLIYYKRSDLLKLVEENRVNAS